MRAKADSDLKKLNLTMSQSHVISFLNRCGGTSTQKDIVSCLNVSGPTVVGLLFRMEHNGYISTCYSQQDRRAKIVSLTPKARKIGKELEMKIIDNEKKMLKSFSDSEVEKLKSMLISISDNLENK